MKKQYDFSKGKRGAVIKVPRGKSRITIRLDDDVLDWFRKQVDDAGGGSYQNLINQALRAYIERSQERSKLSCEGWCGKNCGGRV